MTDFVASVLHSGGRLLDSVCSGLRDVRRANREFGWSLDKPFRFFIFVFLELASSTCAIRSYYTVSFHLASFFCVYESVLSLSSFISIKLC